MVLKSSHLMNLTPEGSKFGTCRDQESMRGLQDII